MRGWRGISAERTRGGIAPLSPGNRPDATLKKKKSLKKRIVLRIHRSTREREAEAGSAPKPGPEAAEEPGARFEGRRRGPGDTPGGGLGAHGEGGFAAVWG